MSEVNFPGHFAISPADRLVVSALDIDVYIMPMMTEADHYITVVYGEEVFESLMLRRQTGRGRNTVISGRVDKYAMRALKTMVGLLRRDDVAMRCVLEQGVTLDEFCDRVSQYLKQMEMTR